MVLKTVPIPITTLAHSALTGVSTSQHHVLATTQVFTGSFTRNSASAPSTQEITGVGFTVKGVIFFMAQAGDDEMSAGVDDGSTPGAIVDTNVLVVDSWGVSDLSIFAHHAGSPDTYGATITTLGTDGFTITWVEAGSQSTGTLTIKFFAWG